jgi:5-deoxy-glucuronate isomerase
VTEVLTPEGNGSSYCGNRHDKDGFPRISYFEKTNYHSLKPAEGFGLQVVYTEDGRLDEALAVSDGDVGLVPRGHHPCGARCRVGMYYHERHGRPAAQVAPPGRPGGQVDHGPR